MTRRHIETNTMSIPPRASESHPTLPGTRLGVMKIHQVLGNIQRLPIKLIPHCRLVEALRCDSSALRRLASPGCAKAGDERHGPCTERQEAAA